AKLAGSVAIFATGSKPKPSPGANKSSSFRIVVVRPRRLVILSAIFHPSALYRYARRSVNLVKHLSRPAVFPGLLRFAASDFPQSARLHERQPSRPIGSSQNQSGFSNQAA